MKSFENRLPGKVALVSGGARGLGAAQVRGLARAGAKVVIGDILEAEGRALAGQVNDSLFVRLDVTREEDWQAAIATTVGRFGQLDILVNNAGIVLPKAAIEDRTAEEWDRLMAINVKGVFLGTKHAIPAMRANGGGSIINISSLAGIGQSQLQEAAYAASKGAVRLFSKVAGTQHAHEGIRCNSLHPGPVDTGMLRHTFAPNPEALAKRLTRVPMARLGREEEIVAGVIFLASDESSFMTAAELVIDGGCVAQ